MESIPFITSSFLKPFLFGLMTFWPLMVITGRAGFSRWWGLLGFIPYLGLIIVASILTFRPWPSLADKGDAA